MKILILVLSFDDGGIYSEFTKCQKNTWVAVSVDGIETLYYFGNSNVVEKRGEDLHLFTEEGLYNIGKKTLKCFEYIKNLNFDYVYRVNSISYVDKTKLKLFLEDKPRNNFYCGLIGQFQDYHYASGSGYVLSKNLLHTVLDSSSDWGHTLIDDVALGKLLTSKNVTITPALRADVVTNHFLDLLLKPIPLTYHHYRFKSKNKKLDIKQMKRTYKKIVQK